MAKSKKSVEPKVEKPKAEPEATETKAADPKPKSSVYGPRGEYGVPSPEPVKKPEEKGIRVRNVRNKAVTIMLEHEVYCAQAGRCVCSTRDVVREERVERGSAALAPKRRTLRLPRAIVIPPRGETEPLHEAAKQCTDVRNGIMNRPQKLKVVPA